MYLWSWNWNECGGQKAGDDVNIKKEPPHRNGERLLFSEYR
jgi:hypothetical protein